MVNKTRYQGDYAIKELLQKDVSKEFNLMSMYPNLMLILFDLIENTLQSYGGFAKSQEYL